MGMVASPGRDAGSEGGSVERKMESASAVLVTTEDVFSFQPSLLHAFRTTFSGDIVAISFLAAISLSLPYDHDQLTICQVLCGYWPAQLWRSNDEISPHSWTIERTYPCLATRLRSRILHDAEEKKIQNPRHPRSYAVSQL